MLRALLAQAGEALQPAAKARSSASKRAGSVPPTPATPASGRGPLVSGILLVLERAAQLAGAREAAVSELAAGYQRHPWLWELLVRKHWADVAARPDAAGVVVEVGGFRAAWWWNSGTPGGPV